MSANEFTILFLVCINIFEGWYIFYRLGKDDGISAALGFFKELKGKDESNG